MGVVLSGLSLPCLHVGILVKQ